MKTIIVCLIGAGTLLAQYAPVPSSAYPALDAIINGKAAAATGSSVPGSCTDGKDWYTTAGGAMYWCVAGTFVRIQANLGFTPLNAASNLSDLANPGTARTNLGLGSAAVQPSSAFEPAIASSLTTKFFRGDKTFVTLDTSIVPENGNLYFTNLRAQTAMSGLYEVPLTFGSGLLRSGNTITCTGCSGSLTGGAGIHISGGIVSVDFGSVAGTGVPNTFTDTQTFQAVADSTAATHSFPYRVLADNPNTNNSGGPQPSAKVGEIIFQSNAAAGQNTWASTTAGTGGVGGTAVWTLQGGSSAPSAASHVWVPATGGACFTCSRNTTVLGSTLEVHGIIIDVPYYGGVLVNHMLVGQTGGTGHIAAALYDSTCTTKLANTNNAGGAIFGGEIMDFASTVTLAQGKACLLWTADDTGTTWSGGYNDANGSINLGESSSTYLSFKCSNSATAGTPMSLPTAGCGTRSIDLNPIGVTFK